MCSLSASGTWAEGKETDDMRLSDGSGGTITQEKVKPQQASAGLRPPACTKALPGGLPRGMPPRCRLGAHGHEQAAGLPPSPRPLALCLQGREDPLTSVQTRETRQHLGADTAHLPVFHSSPPLPRAPPPQVHGAERAAESGAPPPSTLTYTTTGREDRLLHVWLAA